MQDERGIVGKVEDVFHFFGGLFAEEWRLLIERGAFAIENNGLLKFASRIGIPLASMQGEAYTLRD